MVLLLWAALFFVCGLALAVLAFGGIAIAVSFFTKILFLLSLLCFVVAFALVLVEKIQVRKSKEEKEIVP